MKRRFRIVTWLTKKRTVRFEPLKYNQFDSHKWANKIEIYRLLSSNTAGVSQK